MFAMQRGDKTRDARRGQRRERGWLPLRVYTRVDAMSARLIHVRRRGYNAATMLIPMAMFPRRVYAAMFHTIHAVTIRRLMRLPLSHA